MPPHRHQENAEWEFGMSQQVRGLSWKGYEGQDYENFWTGPAKQHLDQLEQLIVSRSLTGGDTIIDIGAGFGR